MTAHEALRAWIIDDTGFPKKGKHSVGVARQYCGELGKQDNCQVAVSLSVANERMSLPIDYRLYLPHEWTDDAARRKEAGIPEDVVFQTKQEIALGMIEKALREGIPKGVVLTDAGYGNDTEFRDGLQELGVEYAVGIQKTTTVWAPGTEPLKVPPYGGMGRPPKLRKRDKEHSPVGVYELALSLPKRLWRHVQWREGVKGVMESRFARVRVRSAHRDYWRKEIRSEEWLVVEWPLGEPEPTKYWLSTMSVKVSCAELVGMIKMRWRIERDYQELKQEIGLGHFEGRGWRGFHHHATLCIAAYAFLAVCTRDAFPPYRGSFRQKSSLPEGFSPRGAGAKRTACAVVYCNDSKTAHCRTRQTAAALSVLPQSNSSHSNCKHEVMTQ
jgi:SRSO17 transposase